MYMEATLPNMMNNYHCKSLTLAIVVNPQLTQLLSSAKHLRRGKKVERSLHRNCQKIRRNSFWEALLRRSVTTTWNFALWDQYYETFSP